MSAIAVLRDEYPGDAAWQRFVSVFRAEWAERTNRPYFMATIGDEDVAIVLAASLGERAIAWFKTPIGALDKRTPAEVQKLPAGNRILRTLLMRMPR